MALTRLWLTDAPLWILDEPFTALDATAMETLTRRPSSTPGRGDAPSSPPTSRCGRWAVRCAPCASAATLEAGNDACAVGPGTAPAQRGGDPQSALVLSDRHHPVSVRRRRRAQLLAQIAPGVVWVAALLAALLVMDRLFRDDWQDGSPEQLMLLPTPLVAVVLVKVVAHWMMSGLPLLIVSPLAALLLGMSLHDAGVLALTLLLGTPTLSFLGAVGLA